MWTDSEGPGANLELWIELLEADRDADRDLMMSVEERAELLALPEEFTVYRGFSHGCREGISWTLDRERAEMFARRFAFQPTGTPQLLSGVIPRWAVIALLNHREEREVLVLPGDVHDVRTEPVNLPERR